MLLFTECTNHNSHNPNNWSSHTGLKVSTADGYQADLLTSNENIEMKNSGCCEGVMKLWALSYQALGEEIIQCGAWSPLFMCSWRFSSVIHEMYGCKRADSVSGCVLGAYRGGEGRAKVHWREVSFICIWHTSLLCYSDSTIILITVCLLLHPPTPSYFSFYWQERCIYRQICSTFGTSPSNWTVKKSPISAGTKVPSSESNVLNQRLFCSSVWLE